MCLSPLAAVGSLGAGGVAKYAYDQRKKRKVLETGVKRLNDIDELNKENRESSNFLKPTTSEPVSKAAKITTSQRQY